MSIAQSLGLDVSERDRIRYLKVDRNMTYSIITVIIAGNTYRLAANDHKGILAMPNKDRQALLELLESVKVQEVLEAPKSNAESFKSNPKDMSKGELDALAAQLIMKEKSSQKPPMDKRGLYKWIGGFTVVVIFLMLVL